jgi:hypothetical protein
MASPTQRPNRVPVDVVAFEIACGICDRTAIAIPIEQPLILGSFGGEVSSSVVLSFGIISSSGINEQVVIFRGQFDFMVLSIG